ILPGLITISGLTLLYATVASRQIPPRHALIGGTAAGILFEIMKVGFGFYLHSFSTYQTIYGTFAIAPIFLIWIDLSWIVILWGAVLTASLKEFHYHETTRPRQTGWEIFTSLLILSTLESSKKPVSTQHLLDRIDIEPKPLEDLLQLLAAKHYIYQHEQGWIMAHTIPQRHFSELTRLFFWGESNLPPVDGANAQQLKKIMNELCSVALKNADCSIQSILDRLHDTTL
ncbi:MAG: YihY family inner membrane protein, partial [Pseudomonadota bacterium]|nr:YihY family inner membrane protein [Pseudomonadota bacterium]